MKMTMTNVSFAIAPLKLNATDSTTDKPEDIAVMLESEGMSFGIEKMEFEISISEISECFGSNRNKATTTTAPTAAPTTTTTPTEAEKKANEALDICRAILHKIEDIKAASTKAPSAPTKSTRSKKAPAAAPTVGKVTTNDEDEFI
jgi:hypothetical protein